MSRRPKAAYGFIDCASAFVGLANVGAQEDGLAAGFQDPRGDGVAALLVAAGDGDFGAFSGEENGGGFADAGGAAGDESDFVLQTHVTLPEHVGPDVPVWAGERARSLP